MEVFGSGLTSPAPVGPVQHSFRRRRSLPHQPPEQAPYFGDRQGTELSGFFHPALGPLPPVRPAPSWGLSTVGTKSRNSLLNWPGESIEEAFLDTRKQQFSMKCRAQKVVFALFTSQVKENELQFLPYSYFWFLPCSNPKSL